MPTEEAIDSTHAPSTAIDGAQLTLARPLHRIGLTAPELDSAIAFYRDVLGYRLLAASPASLQAAPGELSKRCDLYGPGFRALTIAHLSSTDGVGLAVFQATDPPPVAVDSSPFWRRSGFSHLCVLDPDIDSLIERIEAAGGRRHSSIRDDRPPDCGLRMAHCAEPLGKLIEVHTHPHEWVPGWPELPAQSSEVA